MKTWLKILIAAIVGLVVMALCYHALQTKKT